jgi:hypothetical protein
MRMIGLIEGKDKPTRGEGNFAKGLFILLALMALQANRSVAAQGVLLDSFEELKGWNARPSGGAHMEIAQDAGHTGMGMRLDFDLQTGGRYITAQKSFSIALPKNYTFSFYVRGEAPINNLELKLIDPLGQNVWWHVEQDFSFPTDWQLITINESDIEFAWGPADGGIMKQVGTLELSISAGIGGKGSVWLDELRFEERAPTRPYKPTPLVRASTSTDGHDPVLVLNSDPSTSWKSGVLAEDQWLLIDFLTNREYGGIVIDWDPEDYATAYEVQISEDGAHWKLAYTGTGSNGGRDYIYMPNVESRYLRLELKQSSRDQGYGIRTIYIEPIEFSSSPNHFFKVIAKDAPRGIYPKYFYGEQTYWTVVGVDGDDKEGLLNEEGLLEVDKGSFSIEPFLYTDGKLITWNEANLEQELEQGYLPIPSVIWRCDPLALKITAFATGEPGASTLYIRYQLQNPEAQPQHVRLFLALRPFQVNPPWQSLNMVGGVTQIRELASAGHTVRVNRDKAVISLTLPDRFGAATFDQGTVLDYLLKGKLPPQTEISDPLGYASGVLEYSLDLPPGTSQEVYIAIPFHDPKPVEATQGNDFGHKQFEEAKRYWKAKLDRVEIQLPPTAQKILHTLKSTLAYILINRDGPAIQPGSRNYARSWIRDGALSSAALLGLGYTEEVREFIKWFARNQFADGKIPCCIDRHGPDPVPEHDSNGEFIYTVMEYYRYTRDVGFLREMWPYVVQTVEYIDSLRQQRLAEEFKTEPKLPFYGLMPESISHEGYASQPVHSYWDDFFTLRGLKDAATMATVSVEEEHADRFAALRDAFQTDLYISIARTMARHGINYLPASVEYGDFDPTSTTVAVAPGGELQNLPKLALQRTYEDYYRYFLRRRNGEIAWGKYTPYELRIVGTLTRLGLRKSALEVLEFFLADQRPTVWNQWSEIVWHDPKAPRFIGDMPHTWVGSDYLRSVRSLFAFEQEADQTLVVAAGLPLEWVESENGVTIKRLPTYYGTLNYRLWREAPGEWRLSLSGDLTLPPGKLIVKPPLVRPLKGVTVNGKAVITFDADSTIIGEFPAEVVLQH